MNEPHSTTTEGVHGGEGHGHDDVGIYIKVFIALAVLTAITVAVAYLNIGEIPGLILAMCIAATKGTLVVLYFMHLKHETKNIYIIAAVPLALALILLLALQPDIAGFGRTP